MKRKVKYACVENAGRLREINQDNFLVELKNHKPEESGITGMLRGKCTVGNALFSVFDGMGGEQCGEMASYIASEVMRKVLGEKKTASSENADDGDAVEWLKKSICTANRKINEYMDENGILSMGTTMASVFAGNEKIIVSNVGDSRIYRISGKHMEMISKDHVSIAPMGKKPPLYQYLGIRDEFGVEPHFVSEDYLKGNKYLICSDGLTDMVEENEIETIINKYRISKACRLLMDLAMKNGGRDNITIILLELC